MLDWHSVAVKRVQWWNEQPTDNPFTLNGFDGEWACEDHAGVPQALHNYLMECFPRKARLKDIPIDDINRVLNEAWKGPGSMANIVMLEEQMRQARTEGSSETVDITQTLSQETFEDGDFEPEVELDGIDDDDDE